MPRFSARWRWNRGTQPLSDRAANLACSLGRFDEALQLNRRAAALDPLRAATWANLGFCAGRSGKWEESAAALKKALELTPGCPGAHSDLGESFWHSRIRRRR